MESPEKQHYVISVMSADEMDIAIDWARLEGWNPGLDDAAAYHAADNTGFLIGKLDGEPIATISAVKYGSGFGFVGFYIVKEAFRGRGYGLQIWNEAMSGLRGRTMGLDGVIEQQDNYRKSGFGFAHRNIRFAGKSVKGPEHTSKIFAATNIAFPLLAQYDRAFFPVARNAFLENWIGQKNTRSLVAVEDSRILGFGCIRACRQGFKIGPLNAESDDLALELFTALSGSVPAEADIFLDVPEPNDRAIEMARGAGMAPSFETARMYAGHIPELPLDRIYGITSFELG